MSGAIGKFSDLPYFLTTEYFTLLRNSLATTPVTASDLEDFSNTTVVFKNTDILTFSNDGYLVWNHIYDANESIITKAYLDGPRNTIFVKGGKWSDAYAKVDSYGFKPIRITPADSPEEWQNEDNLNFQIVDSYEKIGSSTISRDVSASGAHFTIYETTNVPRGNVDIENSNEIYIRKDSLFHDWFRTYKSEYSDFINDRKDFAFLGPIYKIINTENNWNVIHKGMKNFAIDSFPTNNMSERLNLFLWTYYDQIYQQIYNLQKNIFSLLDPNETDIRWLGLLEKLYGIDIDGFETSEAQKRDFVKNTINFLKRKGSYSSIFIIWKASTGLTQDAVTIYDRWHDSSITGCPSANWIDYDYTKFYTGGYPTSDTLEPSGEVLSTHYRVEIDHSVKPLNSYDIMDQATMDSLIYGWDIIRPITRVAHYNQVVYPYTDFTGRTMQLYTTPETATWNSKCLAVTTAVAGASITVQNLPESSFSVIHGLNTDKVLVQAYDTSLQRVLPLSINIPNTRYIDVTFESPFTGAIFVTVAEGSSNISTPSNYWNISHMLNQKLLLAQVVDSDNNIFLPEELQLVDNNTLTVTTSGASGYSIEHKGEFFATIPASAASTTWTVAHNLGYIGAMIEVYDQNYKQILPDTITLLDNDTCTITFGEPTYGYVLAKRIGSPAVKQDIVNALTDPNSYFKLGDGTDINWNARYYNDVQNQIYTDYLGTVTEDDDNYYFNFEIPKGTNFNITEVAIFNSSGTIMFYTQGSTLYKHQDTVLNIKYKVSKVEL